MNRLGTIESLDAAPKVDWTNLDPESMLPEQLAHIRPHTGEQRLLLAILEDAVRLALMPPSNGVVNQFRLDALEWIRFRSGRIYGFRYCCEHLGLDAEALAERIERNPSARFAFNRTLGKLPSVRAVPRVIGGPGRGHGKRGPRPKAGIHPWSWFAKEMRSR